MFALKSTCFNVLKLTMLLLLVLPQVGQADVVMKHSFNKFVPIKVLTQANTETTAVGEPFEIRLTDKVIYNDLELPSGSTLKGLIIEVREPMRWGRPARFKVIFNEVKLGYLDSGDTIKLTQGNASDKNYHAHFLRNNRHARKTLLSRQAIIGVTANAISIPISLSMNHGLLGAYIIDEVIDAGVGAAEELHYNDPNDKRSKLKRVGAGVLRGTTPIPLMVGLVRKGKHLTYENDEESLAYLRLPKKMWQDVFTQLENEDLSTGSLGSW